jgi:hypothetical protein
MAQHTYHPDSHEHGLADDCPRCAEHAADPVAGLDTALLANLHDRIRRDLPGRSANERTAMLNLMEHL